MLWYLSAQSLRKHCIRFVACCVFPLQILVTFLEEIQNHFLQPFGECLYTLDIVCGKWEHSRQMSVFVSVDCSLTKEMIDAMGGPAHLNYQRFVKYCCQAYNVLRRSTNVVLSLILLMRDAGVEALRGSREQTDTTIAKVCNACEFFEESLGDH